MVAIFLFLLTSFFDYGCQPNNLWVTFISISFVASWFGRSIVIHVMVLRTTSRTRSIDFLNDNMLKINFSTAANKNTISELSTVIRR